jgi:diacylglycerol kinase
MISMKRLFKSFTYAFRGLVKTFREEQNLRIQTTIAAGVAIAAWYLDVSRLEWCILILTIGMVILAEIINTAIELVTDVLKPRINGYVKIIKDVMAAAVMMSSIAAVIIGIIIFWPYLSGLF